jgi:glycosyltransferase involved in cell wall biosynthesis
MGTKRVVMLGPALAVRGGIASLERIMLRRWASDHYAIRHLATYVDGTKGRKLAVAIGALARFLIMAATRSIDIVHVHFSSRASILRKSVFVLVSRLFGIPLIGHAHGGEFRIFYEQECGPLRRAYVRAIFRRFDRLIVLSPQWSELYRSIEPGLDPVVIGNTVPLPELDGTRRATPPVVLTLGRLNKGKGTYDTLQAIPRILARHPDTEFWFGGDGEVEQVRELVACAAFARNVRLLGWLGEEQKSQALRQASIFLLPSYNEGMPMAVVEAMAYGLAVAATPVGGIPEVVIDGRTGVLVRTGDSEDIARQVSALLADEDLRSRLGRDARELIRTRFDIADALKRIGALYDDLLAEPERRR